jgi:O-acetyl-ADP-ribose deacetylase (regulator of RNase III)
MGKYKEIKGDLIKLALKGEFNVIAHGCNCFNTMGAGIAVQMAHHFGCDEYPMEQSKYRGEINKLGSIEGKPFVITNKEYNGMIGVVNAYTQFEFSSKNGPALDYEALTLCLRKINYKFSGLKVGLPMIGCGLAGGDWKIVNKIIKKELNKCDVSVVIFE